MTDEKNRYDAGFYSEHVESSNKSAGIILTTLLNFLPKINSAVDFGCGLGTWLAVLNDLGIKEIKGYDGHWVDLDSLRIPKECFTVTDLDKKVLVEKRYDLAMSMEVAEHLNEETAKIFIETLTDASDIILFSAAIPYQSGLNHINEQWQDYWYNLFKEFDYAGIDIIRRLIWDDKRISFWYRQNIILYVKKDKIKKIKIPDECFKIAGKFLNIVHPEMYIMHIGNRENNNQNISSEMHIRKIEADNILNMPLFCLYKIVIKRTVKRLIGNKIWEYLKRILKNKKGT